MIQIQSQRQFRNASLRARAERMMVRPITKTSYSVTNQLKGHAYTVRFVSINGKPFGECSCPAGRPERADEAPLVCKHLAAAVTVHIALVRMECGTMRASTRMITPLRLAA